MICKQTINGRMQHDMSNKQLLDVCSMIRKQTITGGM